ncbi:MAG: DUF1566 domain-containing protein [Campylobacterales bacterium]|nr:DUF1566 domain-containing protein [Campylobacterales bacterium]
MKKTLLTLMAIATLASADFTKSGDIVTDSTTGLQWQDDATAASTQLTWQAAIDHCEALTLGGHSDWRLPNINELKSIIDRTKINPAIVSGFANTSSDFYWSSTTLADNSDNAWHVYFNFGYVSYHYNKGTSLYVRCVRAGE